MNSSKNETRNENKKACKSKHHHLFSALHKAIKQYRGGFETLSYSTKVCASTLRNQLNPKREEDSPTLETFLDVLEVIDCPDFNRFFQSYYLNKHDEQNVSNVELTDVLHSVSIASEYTSIVLKAVEDGVLTIGEKREILSALNANIDQQKRLAKTLEVELRECK